MAPEPAPVPPKSWIAIAIRYVVFALFIVGAWAAYAFTVFDEQMICERATDLCELAREKLYQRDVTVSFRPSQVERARITETPKGKQCVEVDTKDGELPTGFCSRFSAHFVGLFNEFIEDSTKARIDIRADRGMIDYVLVGWILLFSFVPFWEATTNAIRRLRLPP